MREALGLRSLCMHYFQEDVQPDGINHSCTEDVSNTMRLFQLYVKIKKDNITEKMSREPSNEIMHFKQKLW